MRSTSTSFLVCAVGHLVLLSAGCKEEEKPLSEQQFCVEYARRECAMVTTWCAFPSADACHKVRASACEVRTAAWKSATRPYRAENTRACLDKVSAVYASQPISADNLKSVESICARVYGGNVAANAACTSDVECQKDLICDKGFCGPRKVVAAGAGCSNLGEVCPAGQWCKPATGMSGFSFCQKRQDKGMTCSATDPCLETYRCSGTCIDRLPLSAACTGHDDCSPAAAICDPYAKVCVPALGFAIGSISCQAFMGTGGTPSDAGSTADTGSPGDTGSSDDAGAEAAASAEAGD
jgi:hypothetical protein